MDGAEVATRRSRALADTRSAVAHLVRRAAFGAPPEEIDALAAAGYEAAVETLCDLARPDPAADAVPPPTFAPATPAAADDPVARQERARRVATERRALQLWWVRRMVAADRPTHEKLTFLWHDHFATSIDKVRGAERMHRQHRTLHDLGPGPFDRLVHAMARDPAMLVWLDGRDNRAGAPNENFARELLELFTLGTGGHGHDRHDRQPYTEADVADAARALTGWAIGPGDEGVLDPGRHDHGTKTVLGTTGALGLDEVVAAATRHPACAPHVVARIWSRLARPAGPDDPVVQELADGFARDLDATSLLRRILLHPDFLAPATRAALVKTPVDLVVGTARTLGTTPDETTMTLLVGLGQVPFAPPDVAGWPANEAWLSTETARVRLRLAASVSAQVASEELVGPPAERPTTLARLLGIDRFGPASAAALRAAPGPRAALTLALASPEHVVA